MFNVQAIQLFTSVLLDSAGIDYHVVLAQNALQQCLSVTELQAELLCALIKQTSRVHTLPQHNTTGGQTKWTPGGASGAQVNRSALHKISKTTRVSGAWLWLFHRFYYIFLNCLLITLLAILIVDPDPIPSGVVLGWV